MRLFLAITLLFSASLNFAQEKSSGPRDSTFFLNFNIGANGFSNNSSSVNEFGISIAESTFGAGPFVGIGWEYRMKNKIGIHADVATHFATRSKKRFIPAFDTYYSNYEVIYEQNTLADEPGLYGGLYHRVNLGVSYLLRMKGVGLFPKLVVGWQSSVENNYRYTLREPSTNYYTNYRVSTDVEWSPYFGAGFTVLFSEYDLAGVSVEAGYSNTTSNYTISQSSYDQPLSYEEITTNHQKLYWKISLLLRMDFALIK